MSAVLSAPSGATPNTATPAPRNQAQAITTQLLRTPLEVLAKAIGKDESAACRMRAGERACTILEWLSVLDAIGFKVVSKEKQCVAADELRMLRRTYAHVHALNDGVWDDPE